MSTLGWLLLLFGVASVSMFLGWLLGAAAASGREREDAFEREFAQFLEEVHR